MTDLERERVLNSVSQAVSFKPAYMTNDKLEAAVKGHGSLVISAYAISNSIAEDIFCPYGAPDMELLDRMTLVDASVATLPLDMVMEKAINSAKLAGATPENAALLAAAFAYFTGSCARSGVPLGNRKLGAIARIHAGVPRTSAISLITGKFTHKIPAFPAYMAIYEELVDKKLTRVDGSVLPPFVSGGAMYGHSALGEDYNFPELAYNAAKVGTEAMIKSMHGAGIYAYPLWPAFIGSAITLEMIHSDAALGEEYGTFTGTDSAYMAGKGAMDAAGIPAKIHVRGTNEEYDTARVIGDFGLILKDIGGPSVVGSMALDEVFAGFQEAATMGAGFSGGPVNAPLGHVLGDCMPAIRMLIKYKGDVYKTADDIREYKMNSFIDPEYALCSLNTIARKAEDVTRGSVSTACLLASEDVKQRAVYRRAVKSYEMLKAGKTVEEVARQLDDERKAYVEERGSQVLSGFTGKDIKVRFTSITPQGRRTDNFTKKFWAFDANICFEATVNGKDYKIDNFAAKVIPEYVVDGKGRDDPDMGTVIFAGSVLSQELQYVGHTILNITIPAATGALLGGDPKNVAKDSQKGAYLTSAIPGGKEKAMEVVAVAKQIYDRINEPFP
ncbi:hypothetical protein [Methanolacinia paynteri]|uniref:hypothetical protein n=1 Tax=Methanolacinia paynteri TaxID=230356 RepID=UPI00064EBFFE|nr:hypothetical protein [Methanolacinia paynteri]